MTDRPTPGPAQDADSTAEKTLAALRADAAELAQLDPAARLLRGKVLISELEDQLERLKP